MVETWSYEAESLEAMHRVLAEAARAAVGTPVRVAPFDDELLAKVGVWLQGKAEDVEAVRGTLDDSLRKGKIKFSAMRWQETRRRG